jgi:hypothetical protein
MIFRIKILYSCVIRYDACGLADEDSGSRFFQNVGITVRNVMESHNEEPQS